jgi:predicted nucleic acid-binding protein
MIVHVDTSALVDALTGPRRSLPTLTGLVEARHRLGLSTLVLYEWLRGPRTSDELAAASELFPAETIAPFDQDAAAAAAALYRAVRRPRGREFDLAVAGAAIAAGAALWTLNRDDFSGLPQLRLVGR